jgi:hypothetical protein
MGRTEIPGRQERRVQPAPPELPDPLEAAALEAEAACPGLTGKMENRARLGGWEQPDQQEAKDLRGKVFLD